jgi:hypothetical protein
MRQEEKSGGNGVRQVGDYESKSESESVANPSRANGRKRAEKSKRATEYEQKRVVVVDDVEFDGSEDFQKPEMFVQSNLVP